MTNPQTEPPHASIWPEIRNTCETVGGRKQRRPDTDCAYPWCKCSPAGIAKRQESAMERENRT